jgi:hypothetical protein
MKMLFRMFPALMVGQQTVVANGRTYTGTLGSAQDIIDIDAEVLGANGWTKVSLSGPTSARPSFNPYTTAPYSAGQGVVYYDTTLSQFVISDGQTWRTVAGVSA